MPNQTRKFFVGLCLALTACLGTQTSSWANGDCHKRLIEATQSLADGDAVKAAETLQSMSNECSGNAQYQTLRAAVFLRLAKFDESEQAALKALEIQPNSIAARFQYALVLKALGKRESAVAAFDKVVALDPSNWESWASLGDLYRQMHEDDKAKQCEYKAATLAAPTIDARLSLFKNLIKQGKLAKAEEEFTKAIATNAQSPIVEQQLAKQALLFNFWQPAVAASEIVLKSFPDSQEALTSKATAEYFQHKYQDCQNTLALITKNNPDSPDAKVLSALCLMDLGQISDAAVLLETANAPKYSSALSQFAAGKWHQALGDYKAAETSLGQVSDDKVLPEAQLALSRLYLKKGNLDEAIDRATFSPTSELVRCHMLAQQSISLCQEQPSKARELAERALKYNAPDGNTPTGSTPTDSTKDPSASLAMANVELASKNYSQAEVLANEVIRQIPGSADAYLVLAQVALASGNNQGAEKQLDKVQALSNDDPEAGLLLGQIYLTNGNAPKALDTLKAALSIRQGSPQICYVLAKALEQIGDRKASLKYYKQSLSLGLGGTENSEATQAIKRLTVKSQE